MAYFPIYIKSDIKEDVIIDDDIVLQPMTDTDKLKAFGSVWEEQADGSWSRVKNENEDSIALREIALGGAGFAFVLSRYFNLLYSNYWINTSEVEKIKRLNFAIKLLKSGCSGFSVGLKIGDTFSEPVILLLEAYWCKLKTTVLNYSDIDNLKLIYSKIDLNNKTAIDIIERYNLATSNIAIPLENRFVDLTIILEMLYGPKDNRNELQFRVSLLIAKLFKNKFNGSTKDYFDEMIKIYGTRSDIVHTGGSKKLTKERLINLIDIARESILLYLKDESTFSKENLESLYLND